MTDVPGADVAMPCASCRVERWSFVGWGYGASMRTPYIRRADLGDVEVSVAFEKVDARDWRGEVSDARPVESFWDGGVIVTCWISRVRAGRRERSRNAERMGQDHSSGRVRSRRICSRRHTPSREIPAVTVVEMETQPSSSAAARPVRQHTIRDAERAMAERRRTNQIVPQPKRDREAITRSRQDGDRYRKLASNMNGNLGTHR
jgi:hypothetical protein